MTSHVDKYFHASHNQTTQLDILLQVVVNKAKIIILHKGTPTRPHQLKVKHITPSPLVDHTNHR